MLENIAVLNQCNVEDNKILLADDKIDALSKTPPDALLDIAQSAAVVTESERRHKLYWRYIGDSRGVPIMRRKLTRANPATGVEEIDTNPARNNNKIHVPIDATIANTATGYLNGKPITIDIDKTYYDSDEKADAANSIIKDYRYYADFDNVNTDVITYANVCGYGVKILYTDTVTRNESKTSVIRSQAVPPWEVILFGNDYTAPDAALRVYTINTIEDGKTIDIIILEYYTDTNMVKYQYKDKGWSILDNQPLYFGYCPVIGFPINQQIMGRAEPVISLMDGLDQLMSDIMNEIDGVAMAQKVIMASNLPKEIAEIAILKDKAKHDETLLSDNADGNANIFYLEKKLPEDTYTNQYNRYKDQIYAQSNTPDVTKENFGTQAGIALEYVMQSFRHDMSVEQLKFTNAFQREFELVSNYSLKKENYLDPRSVVITFNVNVPNDLDGEMNRFAQSVGLMAYEDSAAILSNIKDVPAFVERYKKEQAAKMGLTAPEPLDTIDDVDDDVE